MKKIQVISVSLSLMLLLLLNSCASKKDALVISDEEIKTFEITDGEAVEIKSEEVEYEIVIIDPGFNTWLRVFARPKGYYSMAFLENRNNFWVQEWNRRVIGPGSDIQLYEMQINYDPGIDYGYDLNYELYNYFIYFQRRYGQRLGTWVPRI